MSATKAIMRELKTLLREPMEEIHVLPQVDGATTQLDAVICGSAGTPYEGGQFKVRLQIGPDYPAAPPKGFFLTKIFHPNVSKAGEICVNTLKKDWNEKLGVRHVLLTIKCLLIVPNPESALNEEAGKLLLEQYEEYAKQARLMTSIHASKVLVTPAAPADAGAAATVAPVAAAPAVAAPPTTDENVSGDVAGAKKVKTDAASDAAGAQAKKPAVAAAAAAKKKATLKRL